MKIVFTGGGSGGHFYPIIAIAEAIRNQVRDQRLVAPKLYYMGPSNFDEQALFGEAIVFVKSPAGKMRRYASFLNISDIFLTIAGILWSLVTLFRIYPDVVVSTGSYASVPTVLAAHFLGIPIFVHESDAKPGRANLLASKYAARIAVAFDTTASYFSKKAQAHVARTGIAVRSAVTRLEPEGARQELGLDPKLPTILIIGGSLGSKRINETVLSALPSLVEFANVIHQTGPKHFAEVESTAKVILAGVPHAERYHPVGYLSIMALQQAAGAATVVVSRAGAGTITEISLWKKPAILIPIPESISHDQRTNAYAYAHLGAAVVIEEANLQPHLLASEAKHIATNPDIAAAMAAKGASFADPDAAKVIAAEVLAIALEHEK
jgi:UDP-N-acetylglucosamine--N-acetylmuramyl-(pentapeptide) pyrophosphoryl-undecaprenol N-acetylglucosamine transferase